MKEFSIKQALSWGWGEFKKRPWFFIGIVVALFAISAVISFIAGDGNGVFAGLVEVIGVLVQWWLYIGVIMILLAVYNKQQPKFEMLFKGGGTLLWNYILGTLLYALIVIVGTILLIVPGIIWGIKYHYYSFLVIDKGMKPMDAIKHSGVITMGYKWQLFGFFIVLGLLNLLGVIVVGVGLLVSVPVTLLASVFVYKLLEDGTVTVDAVSQPAPSEPTQEQPPVEN